MLGFLMMALVMTPYSSFAADKPEKKERLICKRDTKTGSLIIARRICLTKEDWKLTAFYNRETVRYWQETLDSKRMSQ